MKQIVQSLKTGSTEIVEFPAPQVKPGHILIESTYSLVSIGTERSTVTGTKESLISRAKKNPEKILKLLDLVKNNGIKKTISSISNQIDQFFPLGYCNSGIVIEVGENISDIQIGDRVVSNGPHAEIVSVPRNLVCKIPDLVSNKHASFTVIGAIALQGVRLCKPTVGEYIVVIGLGLVGLMTVQILKANGCRVIGIDIDQKKCDLANSFGAKTINSQNVSDIDKLIFNLTSSGADGVIITASNSDNKIISDAARMSRKRGRIILVGVVGLLLDRSEFFKKELTFQVSSSYGPGRYDDKYELEGIDYPKPFVRWTENRNFESILNLMEDGLLNVENLISQEIELDNFKEIYNSINNTESIGAVIKYPSNNTIKKNISKIILKQDITDKKTGVLGFIGAGGFTENYILPSIKQTKSTLRGISSINGFTSTNLAKKFKFNYSTSDYKDILNDDKIDTVFITTQHDSHSKFVVETLNAQKNVFVEKPLAISRNQLNEVISAYEKNKSNSLIIGFNRRFSPHMLAIKESIMPKQGPVSISITINAGFIPKESWVHDIKKGGGRIIGEACHFLDLCVFLSGSEITKVCMNALGPDFSLNNDVVTILLHLADGSIAAINYFANGSSKYSKERIEVYSNGRTWITDDFKSTIAYGVKNFKNLKTKVDKGHDKQFQELIKQVQTGGKPIISSNEIFNVAKATFSAIKSMKETTWIDI